MDVVNYIAMGKRICKYRMAKKMTQSELAEAVQRSSTTINHIEVGSGKPELNTVLHIANTLEVSMDMLLCDSLRNSMPVYTCDSIELLNSCSAEELRFISAAIPALFDIFRKNK